MEYRLGLVRLIFTPAVCLRALQQHGWEGWQSLLIICLLAVYLVISHLGSRARLRGERIALLLGMLEGAIVACVYSYDSSFNVLLFFLAASMGARFPVSIQFGVITFAWAIGASHDAILLGLTPPVIVDLIMEWGYYFITAFIVGSLAQEERARRRQAFRATVLHQIARATGSCLDLSHILASLRVHTDELYGAGSCSVFLAHGNMLYRDSVPGASGSSEGIPMAAAGAVGKAFREGVTVCLETVGEEPLLMGDREGTRYRAMISPLVGKNRTMGVIAVTCPAQQRLDTQDLQLLETIAAQAAAAIELAGLYREAVVRSQLLELLYELSQALDEVHNVKGVIATSASYALRLVEAHTCLGLLPDLDGDHFYCAGGQGEAFAAHSGLVLRVDQRAVSKALAAGQPLQGSNEELDLELGAPYHCCLVPLVNEHLPVGMLLLLRSPDTPFSEAEMHSLFTLARQAAVSVHSARLYEETQARAVTDGLTALYNHRHFQERLREEMARAARYHLNLALIMLDVDDFKRLNDTEGHPRGDAVLQAVARILRSFARSTDLVARYGGEEFAIIVVEAGREQAVALAERIRSAVKRMSVVEEQPLRERLTVSQGVAAYPENGDTAQALIAAADQALNRAKQMGKDTVVSALPEAHAQA